MSDDNEQKEEGKLTKEDHYSPLKYLEPKQQRFAMLKVTTTLSKSQIEKRLDISSYLRRKWENNEHVQHYINELMEQYADEEVKKTAKRQMKWIRQQMFQEMQGRFRDPIQAAKDYFGEDAIENGEVAKSELNKFKERFAHSANFKDFAKIWEKFDKIFKLDEGEATDRIDSDAIEHRARKEFTKLRAKRRKKKEMEQKAKEIMRKGGSYEDYVKQIQDAEYEEIEQGEEEEQTTEAKPVDEDEEWEEEVVIEKYSF